MTIEERNKKVEENLALVTHSLKLLGQNFNEDYFQQGVLELMRCVECFDESKGFKFSTYAVNNIKLKLKEYIIRDHVIKPKRTGIGGQVYGPLCESIDKNVSGKDDDLDITYSKLLKSDNKEAKMIELQIMFDQLVEQKLISKKNLEIFTNFTLGEMSILEICKNYNLTRSNARTIILRTRNKLKILLKDSYNN